MTFVSAGSRSIALSMAARFLGGVLSHFVSAVPAHAQQIASPRVQANAPQAAAAAKEVRAQKFILVDDEGATRGVLGFEADGTPTLALVDGAGRMIWSSKPRGYPLAK